MRTLIALALCWPLLADDAADKAKREAEARERYEVARIIERAFSPEGKRDEAERKAREVREYWERYEQDEKMRRESSLAAAWAEIDAAKRQSATQTATTQPAPAKRERRQVYTESTTRIGGYLYTTTSDGRQCTSWRQGLDWVTQCY